MRILVIGDLHGRMPHIPEGDFDCIIAPGDFGSDEGIRAYVWQAYDEHLRDPGTAREWWEIPPLDEAKLLAERSVAKGRAILEMLDGIGIPVFVVPGNWDWTGTNIDARANEVLLGVADVWNRLLLKDLRNVRDVAYRCVRLEDLSIVGYGPVNGPELAEHRNPDASADDVAECSEAFTARCRAFDDLLETAQDATILLAHTVPYGTTLDVIDNQDSPKNGMHFGSDVVRYVCEKHQPILCIGGHMHEHFGTDKIGGTVCLNAGFGPDVHTVISIDKKTIIGMELFEKP